MTWDALKTPLYTLLSALLTAVGMYWGVPALIPAPPPHPAPPAPPAVATPLPVPAPSLPTTVVCDTGSLQPTLRLLEGQQGVILEELRAWVAAERKRQAAEAAAWAAVRAKRAAAQVNNPGPR